MHHFYMSCLAWPAISSFLCLWLATEPVFLAKKSASVNVLRGKHKWSQSTDQVLAVCSDAVQMLYTSSETCNNSNCVNCLKTSNCRSLVSVAHTSPSADPPLTSESNICSSWSIKRSPCKAQGLRHDNTKNTGGTPNREEKYSFFFVGCHLEPFLTMDTSLTIIKIPELFSSVFKVCSYLPRTQIVKHAESLYYPKQAKVPVVISLHSVQMHSVQMC